MSEKRLVVETINCKFHQTLRADPWTATDENIKAVQDVCEKLLRGEVHTLTLNMGGNEIYIPKEILDNSIYYIDDV
jgi:hypothetical protein